jgi:hypothetical protein
MISNYEIVSSNESSEIPSELQCIYCQRCFHFHDIYQRHVITCEFFYKGRKNRERLEDDNEVLPTAQEQYKLIQHLLYQNTLLQKKLARIETNILAKKRKIILDCLKNPASPKPSITFFDWIKTINVCFDDLEAMFEHDLISGILRALSTALSPNVRDSVLPLRAFIQKPGTFYIWEMSDTQEVTWRILSVDDFDKWMNKMNHRFLQEFTLWKRLHSEKMRETEEGKDRLIEYMRKIMGLGESYEQRRRSDLKKWLFDKIAVNFEHMVEMEYV